jgi:hypothetical protein
MPRGSPVARQGTIEYDSQRAAAIRRSPTMRSKYFLLIGLGLVLGLVGLGLFLWPAAGPGRVADRPDKANAKDDAPKRDAKDRTEPWNLKQSWEQLAGEANVWRRADITDPQQLFIFDLVAERLHCTTGEITKEQFLAITRRPAAARKEEVAKAKPADGAKQKPKEQRSPTADAPPAGSPRTVSDEPLGASRRAEAAFRRMDTDGDGLLSFDEMDDALKAERDKWDTNGDGFIDLAEFKEYFKARMRQLREAARGPVRPEAGPERGAERPTPALHPSELPPGLPDWFRQYDKDGDGMVGLYEWKAAGQPIAKFLEMDLNGDGFLTPDEVLEPDAEPKDGKHIARGQPEPDPGSLTAYQGQIGKVFRFRVTGQANGGIWGSGPYTADSSLAVAAVHAGVVAVGETKTVRVRIVQPPPQFEGSTANGVTTPGFGQFPGAYVILK